MRSLQQLIKAGIGGQLTRDGANGSVARRMLERKSDAMGS